MSAEDFIKDGINELKNPAVLIPLLQALDSAIEKGVIDSAFVTQLTELAMTKASDALMKEELAAKPEAP